MIQTATDKVIVPEGAELFDECFYVWETRFGLFSSMTTKGRQVLTGGVRDNVVMMTRWHLKCEQEGWPEGSVRVVGSSVVSDESIFWVSKSRRLFRSFDEVIFCSRERSLCKSFLVVRQNFTKEKTIDKSQKTVFTCWKECCGPTWT